MFDVGTLQKKEEGLLGLINIFEIDKDNPSSFFFRFFIWCYLIYSLMNALVYVNKDQCIHNSEK